MVLHQRKLDRLCDAEICADKLFSKIQKADGNLIIALSMMYWCEGAKNDNRIDFTNL